MEVHKQREYKQRFETNQIRKLNADVHKLKRCIWQEAGNICRYQRTKEMISSTNEIPEAIKLNQIQQE